MVKEKTKLKLLHILGSALKSYQIWKWKNCQYSHLHRQRICDGNLPNSLQPMSYLGFIWDLYVLGWKSKIFFVKNPTKYSKPWTRDSQCQDGYCSLAENTQNAPTYIFWPNLSAQAQKSEIFGKKTESSKFASLSLVWLGVPNSYSSTNSGKCARTDRNAVWRYYYYFALIQNFVNFVYTTIQICSVFSSTERKE